MGVVTGFTGMAFRRLNFRGSSLDYASEAVLPFYMVHYAVVLTIGVFVVRWHVAIFWKILVVATTSFVITGAIWPSDERPCCEPFSE